VGGLFWVRHLLRSVLREYALYYTSFVNNTNGSGNGNGIVDEKNNHLQENNDESSSSFDCIPPGKTFDNLFRALLRRSENMRVSTSHHHNTNKLNASNHHDMDEDIDDEDDEDEESMDGHDDEKDEDSSINSLIPEEEQGDEENKTITTRKPGESVKRARELRKKQQQQQQSSSNSRKQKSKKEARVWHDGQQKVTQQTMAALDRSKNSNSNLNSMDIPEDSVALAEARAAYLPDANEIPMWDMEDTLVDDDDDDDHDTANHTNTGDKNDDTSHSKKSSWGSSLKSLMDQMSGNKIIQSTDLVQPLKEMHNLLTSKNVANDIATDICDSVRTKLVGKRMTSFSRIKTAVRQALESVIQKILSPPRGRDIDILKAIRAKSQQQQQSSTFSSLLSYNNNKNSNTNNKKPYVIVMVGINGVGKSTSLAKIAYYLKTHNHSPLLAACDTFRSGAVEQLNVHAKTLGVPLHQMGYAKDPSSVASSAIRYATQHDHDVVLVDTAGRMQNNVPLMKALSKLVVDNSPDLVLFVCEALVGNDGMDQLTMFDRALRSGGHGRQIDGIVLTKFDTVSDKVGAALTMTHVTGAPVVFVGTGQKYTHLKSLSVGSVIKSLFS